MTVQLARSAIVAVVVVAIIGAVFHSRRGSAEHNTGTRVGIALAGDQVSAAGLLGLTGAIAVYGVDGLLYGLGVLAGWLVLLVVAERLRNAGCASLGDAVSRRLRHRPVRIATAVSTLVVSVIYLSAQLAAAGGLVALLLEVPSGLGQAVVTAVVGAVLVGFVLVRGDGRAPWLQIVAAGLLILTGLVLAAWVLGRVGLGVPRLLDTAAGSARTASAPSGLDVVSLALAAVLGPVSLPHVLARFAGLPDAGAARRAVAWVSWLVGGFLLAVVVVGEGAAGLIGSAAIRSAPGSTNAAAPLLALRVGGDALLAVVVAVAVVAILAVAAAVITAAARAIADDLDVVHGAGSRVAVLVVGLSAISGAIAGTGQNVALVVALAFATAAAANLPALVLALWWRRFNTTGALYSIYGGLAATGLALVVSPLLNPAVVAVPVAFVLAVFGTWMGPKDVDARRRFAELVVRSLTGARAGAPVSPIAQPGGPRQARRRWTASV